MPFGIGGFIKRHGGNFLKGLPFGLAGGAINAATGGGALQGLGGLLGISDDEAARISEMLLEQAQNYEVDPGGQMQAQVDRLSDPNYGFDQFRRLAADATPSTSDYLARVRALGGSSAMAQEQFEAARRSSTSDAFNQFGAFGLDREALAGGAMNQLQQSRQFGAQLPLQAGALAVGANQGQSQRGAEFLNQIFSIFASMAGGSGGSFGGTQGIGAG